jgi:MoxR-like ATPase
VLAHRLLLSAEAQIARRSTEAVVTDILATVAVPNDERRRRSG